MGMFANPLSHTGYPPGVTGTPTTQPTAVRAATTAEVDAGVLNNCYVSPATLAIGGGPGVFTTLTSSGNTTLATGAAATAASIFNVAPSGARTGTYHGGAIAQNDTANWFSGACSANTQRFQAFAGTPSGGTQIVGFFTGNASGGTQQFNVLTGTRPGTANIATGIAAHTLNLGTGIASSSIVNVASASSTLGFFGATAAAKTGAANDIKDTLVSYGLVTDSGATPLNLDGGALTAGTVAAVTTITAGTTLTATAGDITATLGNVIINGAAKQLRCHGGAVTDFCGQAVLINGVVTVLNTNIAATDRILVTRSAKNASSAYGTFQVVISAATNFVITSCKADASTETNDQSTVDYFIFRQV